VPVSVSVDTSLSTIAPSGTLPVSSVLGGVELLAPPQPTTIASARSHRAESRRIQNLSINTPRP